MGRCRTRRIAGAIDRRNDQGSIARSVASTGHVIGKDVENLTRLVVGAKDIVRGDGHHDKNRDGLARIVGVFDFNLHLIRAGRSTPIGCTIKIGKPRVDPGGNLGAESQLNVGGAALAAVAVAHERRGHGLKTCSTKGPLEVAVERCVQPRVASRSGAVVVPVDPRVQDTEGQRNALRRRDNIPTNIVGIKRGPRIRKLAVDRGHRER